MTKCDKCPRCAIIYQRYSGKHLCREHFEEDVHRKVREALRRTGLFGPGARIAVGLDGGRKSATLAFVLKNLFIRRRDIDILAVIIDEGRKASPTADQARHVAEQLSLPYIVKSLSLLARKELLFCTARENGAGILATGEDLDDVALEIFLGYLRGDVDAALKEGAPGSVREERQICWIKPLRRIPKREVRLYAIGHDLGYDEAGEKPNAIALRSEARRLLRGFDERHPGTNYSLLRGLEKIAGQGGSGKGKAFK